MGFCLCFIAPEDWIKIVSETSRVLQNNGYLIIHDFMGTRPIRYQFQTAGHQGVKMPVYIYVCDWPSLWLTFPEYKMVHELHTRPKSHVVSVLCKSYADVFKGEDVRQ